MAEEPFDVPQQGSCQAAYARLRELTGDGATGIELIESVVSGVVPTEDADSAVAALTLLRHLREQLAEWEPQLIGIAREFGASWRQLAPALGVASRQAAERRYLRLRPDVAGRERSTGEERVRAERDRRAGDRAVTTWAQRNSARLRQLAGQVAAIEDVTGSARRSIDRVHSALAHDDTTALLDPLTSAGTHLADTHPELAERISAMTDRTDLLRTEPADGAATPDEA